MDIVDNRLINNSSNKNKNVVKLNNKRIVITKERNKDYSVAKNNLVKHKVNQNFRTPKKEPRKNKYSIN